MLGNIREDVTRTIAHAQFQMEERPELPELPDFITTHFDPFSGEDDSDDFDAGTRGLLTTTLPPLSIPRPMGDEFGEDPAEWEGKVSRNAPCPCGSGAQVQALPRRRRRGVRPRLPAQAGEPFRGLSITSAS